MKFSERFSCFFQRFRLASRGVMELRGVPPASFRGPPPKGKAFRYADTVQNFPEAKMIAEWSYLSQI